MNLNLFIFRVDSIRDGGESLSVFRWKRFLRFNLRHIDSGNRCEHLHDRVVVDKNVFLVLQQEVETEALMSSWVLHGRSELIGCLTDIKLSLVILDREIKLLLQLDDTGSLGEVTLFHPIDKELLNGL